MRAPSAPSTHRAAMLSAVSVVLLTTAYLFAPLWLGIFTGDERFFEWDVPEQYWPDLTYLCRSLHHGDLPYWNPYDRGGYPYYADPQSGAYHPLNWGICAMAGASPGLGWAELRVVLGFLFAGLFGLLWLRRLGVSWTAATLGAVVIECAPFMRHNWELNLTLALGFLPMVLWALERALQHRTARDAALLAIAEGLLVWTGSPPVIYFAGTFTAIYAAARVVSLVRANPSVRTSLARTLGLATLLVVGFSAVVLVPGLTLAGYSVQAGRSYESIADGGLDGIGVTALLWPRDGNHLYVGIIALLLAPLAFLKSERPLPARWALLGCGVAAVLLSMGDHGPLFGVAFDLVPGVHLFRLPHRYEAWLGPVFGALAAGGLDAALRIVAARWPKSDRPPITVAIGVALAVLLVLDVTRRMPDDRHTRAAPTPGNAADVARVMPRASIPGYRVMDEFGISCRAGTRLGIREFRGYQDPLSLHAFERAIASLREHPHLAEQFNVRYALTGPHFIHGWDRHFLPPPEELLALDGAIDRGEGVIELSNAMPMAYWVPSASVEYAGRREDALVRTIALAPARIAVLEGDESRCDTTRDADRSTDASARVVAFESDAMRIDVQAPSDGMLVVNETWYPGWVAEVDGESVEVVRANGLVRALPVPGGDHRVELRFEPPDGAPLRWLLLVSWLAALGMLVWPRRPRSKPASGPPPAPHRNTLLEPRTRILVVPGSRVSAEPGEVASNKLPLDAPGGPLAAFVRLDLQGGRAGGVDGKEQSRAHCMPPESAGCLLDHCRARGVCQFVV